jgi:hypothetical protein
VKNLLPLFQNKKIKVQNQGRAVSQLPAAQTIKIPNFSKQKPDVFFHLAASSVFW